MILLVPGLSGNSTYYIDKGELMTYEELQTLVLFDITKNDLGEN